MRSAERRRLQGGVPVEHGRPFRIPDSAFRVRRGCRGWNRTSIRAFKGRCPTIRRPGKELVEPEAVAASPGRIKSPVPVFCGFGS